MLKGEYRNIIKKALINDIEKELNIPPFDFWKSGSIWDVSIDSAIDKKYKINILCSRELYKKVKEYVESVYNFKEENLITKTYYDNIHCCYLVEEDKLEQVYGLLRIKGTA